MMPRLPLLLSLALLPSAVPALDRGVADALFQRQAYAVAAEAYRAGIGDGGLETDGSARLGLAESAWRLGQADRAREAWSEYLLRHVGGPGETRALLGLSRALARGGDAAGAVKAARQAEANASGDQRWRAGLLAADALYEEGLYLEADQAYLGVGQRYSGQLDEPAYIPYARGWCLYKAAQLPRRGTEPAAPDSDADSRTALRHGAELFGQVAAQADAGRFAPSAAYQQAECLYLLGDYEAAAKDYGAFEGRWPDQPLVAAARYSLAWCRFQQGKYQDAATAFHRFAVVHADHPLAPWGLYLAGVSLARGHDLDMAESAYQVCLRQYPGSPVVERCRYGLAWLATMRHDYATAADDWQQFLQDAPDSDLAASATFLLADAQYQQQRYAAAHDQYLALLKRWPKEPLAEDALYYAANASLALGEDARARDELQQFLRLRPGSAYALDARRRLGDALYAAGQLPGAEAAYQALRRDAPGTPEAAQAALGLGWVAFSRKDWAQAAARFKVAGGELPVAPGSGQASAAEAWLRAGDSLFNLGDHAGAQALYRLGTRDGGPKDLRAQCHLGAGWCAYREKDFAGAYGEWGNAKAVADDKELRAEAAYWMGWALFRQGRWDEAAAAYAQVAAEFPQDHRVPDALVQQANSLQNGGHCDQALPIYQHVAEAFPTHPMAADALHGLQLCYSALGRDEEAVAAAKAFLKAHADAAIAPEVQYQVAEHYLARKDYVTAEKELDTLKADYPKSSVDLVATYWRGEARFKNLKFNEAIQDWKDLVARQPDFPLAPRALFRTGLAWYRLQEYGQAEATFRQVLDAYGNTLDVAADARFNLGMTYKRMGRDADAVTAYQAVAKDYPDSELADMARIRIGYIYEDAGDSVRAADAYRALAATNKGKLGAEAQYLVGDCLLAQKRSGEALLAYDAVADAFPAESGWVVTALAKSGELLETLGRDKEALQRYERIVKMGGDPTWVASAQKRMDLVRARLGLPAPGGPPPHRAKAVKGKAKPKMKVKPKPAEAQP
jgi:TolA-binding protein